MYLYLVNNFNFEKAILENFSWIQKKEVILVNGQIKIKEIKTRIFKISMSLGKSC